MKKRLLSVLLAMLMVLSLAACGAKNEEPAQEPEREEDTVETP